MKFCYFSCLGRYCFQRTSMAALQLQLLTLARCVQLSERRLPYKDLNGGSGVIAVA